jgi:class 3 adenylate cyclase
MNKKKLTFKKRASAPEQAFVLVFDLEGFSKFFSQPDVHYYVAKYLNKAFQAMDILIYGGDAFWIPENEEDAEIRKIDKFKEPVHVKFMGDGALYIWTFKPEEEKAFRTKMIIFINMLWNFRLWFDKFIESCADDVPVVDLPRNIRFGMASGSVYKLSYEHSRNTEYIGYCINLASRLQSYCRDLGFIASARIGIEKTRLEKHKYHRVIANKLKGLPDEIVIIDKKDYVELSPEIKKELFLEIGGEEQL